jgi:calcium-dependent protein kinase
MGCGKTSVQNKIIQILPPATNEDEQVAIPSRPTQKSLSNKDKNIQSSLFVAHKKSNIHEDYLISDCICIGGLGSVRLAVHRLTKQERALKTIKKIGINTDLRVKAQFINEIDILKKTSHPNIVKLFEFYEDDLNFYLVLELLKGGDLVSYLLKHGKLSERATAYFFRQVLAAVSYCHSQGIVHRDLTLDHLMLETQDVNGTLKVVDFGTAAWFDPRKRLTRKYGTTYYIAPEVLCHSYSEKCDVWSCGVVLFILLSGCPPFDGDNEREVLGKVLKGNYSFSAPVWAHISPEARNLINRLLTYDDKLRPSASEVLQDPWLVKNSQTFGKSSFDLLPIFNNLRQFSSKQKLQRAILTFIASQLLSKEETQELSQHFRGIDADCDGKITKEELILEYEKKLSKQRAKEEVEKIMDQVDTDKSGFIDYTEFIIATMTKEKLLSRKNLERSFKAFDKDSSGKITLDELKDFLGNETMGSQSAWSEILREDNGDGELDQKEFMKVITKMFQ